MFMDNVVISLVLILLGLCMGSFAGASVWRLRARQLAKEKADGECSNQDEYKKLHKLISSKMLEDHSRCLNCSYKLKWYDLIPLFSWLSLRGKCRKCHSPIGWMEPLIEIGVALFFLLSYMYWPYSLSNFFEISRLVLWLVAGVGLAILFAYDKKWFILPNSVSFVVIGIGIVNSLLLILSAQDKIGAIFSIIGSILILSGIYLILYLLSHGKWIGFGDIKLGLGLALLLADWRLAFIALFAANLIGCIIVLPALITRKLKRDSHIPFGPLLIIGTLVACLIGNYLLFYYFFGI